ncbi:MAG: hypothetical protein ACAH11_05370 [Sphingomonas sp.]
MRHARRLSIAALALLLPAAPAWAEWGATKWGMTLTEVLDAVPGARPLKQEGTKGDVWKHHRLASAPWQDGKFAMIADFYFEPDTNRLGFVKSEPVNIADCPALETEMVTRHGAGTREDRDIGDMHLLVIRWVDPATSERLLYSSFYGRGQPPRFCHFIQQAPV